MTCTRYVSQLASALAYCHGEGVLHLDVKPANVIVARSGDLKLGDFGSARSAHDPEARGVSPTVGQDRLIVRQSGSVVVYIGM